MSNKEKMSENAMFEYINETPAVLQRILNERKEFAKEFVENFKKNDYKRFIIIGSGTSYHGGLSTRSLVERILKISVEANYPILYKKYTSVFDRKTIVLGISQGGESKSTIQGLEYSKANNCFTVSLTEDGKDSVLAKYSDMPLQLKCGPELAGPKTKGYQATMLSIIVLALETGLAMGTINQVEYDGYVNRIQKTIDNIQNVIDNSVKWYNNNREELKMGKRMIVVGYDNNYGNVLEGCLKIEEALRYGIEGYELEEFMHGIYHSIDEGVHIVYLGQAGEYKERIIRLKNLDRKSVV